MKLFIALILGLVIFSCQKVEGPGGSSVITGKIYTQRYDAANNEIGDPYATPKEDIYILYGTDDNYFDDDIETSHDGSFRFEFLRKGNYQVFVYEDCNSCPSGKAIVLKDVEISSNKSTIDLGTITIRKDL